MLELLTDRGAGDWARFADLVADCDVPLQIVARFLALAGALPPEGRSTFEQPEPLGDLHGELDRRGRGGPMNNADAVSDEDYRTDHE